MSEPFIGEIRIFGFNFAPLGWAFCDGQLVPISQNTALFSLLGTFYGGNGTTTFALPNLQGRFAVAFGQGNGLSSYSIGDLGGVESVTLTEGQLPAHTHGASGSQGGGNSLVPTQCVWSADAAGGSAPYTNAAPDVNLSPNAIGSTGQNLPHENRPPFLALNFCIALQGIFPSRQ
jgi:microcystin-dependent protein